MTVRDFIQIILIETPSLDADVYIGMQLNDIGYENYGIESISSGGSNDSISINLTDLSVGGLYEALDKQRIKRSRI